MTRCYRRLHHANEINNLVDFDYTSKSHSSSSGRPPLKLEVIKKILSVQWATDLLRSIDQIIDLWWSMQRIVSAIKTILSLVFPGEFFLLWNCTKHKRFITMLNASWRVLVSGIGSSYSFARRSWRVSVARLWCASTSLDDSATRSSLEFHSDSTFEQSQSVQPEKDISSVETPLLTSAVDHWWKPCVSAGCPWNFYSRTIDRHRHFRWSWYNLNYLNRRRKSASRRCSIRRSLPEW